MAHTLAFVLLPLAVAGESCQDSSALLQADVRVASAEQRSRQGLDVDYVHGDNFINEESQLSALQMHWQSQPVKMQRFKRPSKAEFDLAYAAPFVLVVLAWFLPWMHDKRQRDGADKAKEDIGNKASNAKLVQQEDHVQESAGNSGRQDSGSEGPAPPEGSPPSPEEAASSLWHVVRRIGPLWPINIVAALSMGLAGPSVGYIGLNFFAQHHTTLEHRKIHCELNPISLYCRQAVMDLTQINMWVGLVAPLVQIVLGPALGALSDTFGRRPVLVVCILLSVIPSFAVASFVYFDTSLYASYWMTPLADLPYGAVAYAYAVDRMEDSKNVASAFSVMAASSMFFRLVGMAAGSTLTLTQAFTASFIGGLVTLAWILLLLPESLSQEKRKPLDKRLMIPGYGLKILIRNTLLARLAYCAIIAHFLDSGFNSVIHSYLQLHLNWNAHDSYIGSILASVSGIVWLVLGLRLSVVALGELGVLTMSRWLGLAFYICLLLVRRERYVFLLNATICGPISLGLPVIAALKSQCVTPSEQGLMQGALNTVTSIAGSLGPLAFGVIFTATNNPTFFAPTSNGKQLTIYSSVLSVPILVTLMTSGWLVRKYIVSPRKLEKAVD